MYSSVSGYKISLLNLITGPSGNSKSLFSSNLNDLPGQPWETLRFEGNKMNCFLRDQSLSDLLYSWKFNKSHCNEGHRSIFTGNSALSALLLSDVTNFAMLPFQRFWWETVSLSCDL